MRANPRIVKALFRSVRLAITQRGARERRRHRDSLAADSAAAFMRNLRGFPSFADSILLIYTRSSTERERTASQRVTLAYP